MAEENRNQDECERVRRRTLRIRPAAFPWRPRRRRTGQPAEQTEAAAEAGARARNKSGRGGRKKKTGWIYNVGIAVCACVFLVCAFLLGALDV